MSPLSPDLLAAARAADAAAVEAVYLAYGPGVRAWLAVRVGDGPLADELTGDAFVAVLAALPSYAGSADAFAGWVYALVRAALAGRPRPVPATASGADEVRALLGAGLSAAEAAVVTGRTASAVRDLGRDAVAPPPLAPALAGRHLARLAATRVEPATRTPRHRVRAVLAASAIAAALAFGAAVAVASPTGPGDALYGFKTARERIQLSMARPGDSRAGLELRLARTRLGEAARLFRAGDGHRAVETLARADAALASARAQGGDRVDAGVDAELDRRIELLERLLAGGLPPDAREAAREALERARVRAGR
ncbi:MAG: hypothetical protein QOE45_1785 [Frankiaceae bacterium]|nr:hypothetical protein [Frankiaceae bacterium]